MKGLSNQERRRFLSPEECRDLQARVVSMHEKGGKSEVRINSAWTGNIRWARNRVISGGDTEGNRIQIGRRYQLNEEWAATNSLTTEALSDAVLRAETNSLLLSVSSDDYNDPKPRIYPHSDPKIWFDDSYNLNADERGKVAARIISNMKGTGFFSAGYVEVSAIARSVQNTDDLSRYYPYTVAQFSITVRDPKSRGSGWAGVDFNEWSRIDTDALSQIALDKCIRSLDPVAIEPGRYTTILEPQAMGELWSPIMDPQILDRWNNEENVGPFQLRRMNSKIGLRVIDERISVSADPLDPDCSFPPFDWNGDPFKKVNWIENGVLKELPYSRRYAVTRLGHDIALPNSEAFSMSGGDTSIEEMIETTKRGLIVTRFHNVKRLNPMSMLVSGTTRDGLWLIENGKITKAVKNFRFVDSPLFVLNNLVQVGKPQRIFRPEAPAVCPPVKSNDFSFTALIDAV